MRPLPDRLSSVARRQLGIVSRAQARADLSDSAIRWLLESGAWLRVSRGVYRTHHGPMTWPMRAHAALLHAGPGAALSGESALFVHGIVPRAPQVLAVAIPKTRAVARVPGMRISRRSGLHVVTVGGFSVLDAADAVLDRAASPLLDDLDCVALVTDAVRTGALTTAQLAQRLDEWTRHPRRAVLRLATYDVEDGVESVMEVIVLRRVIRAHGLPPMRCQSPGIADGGRVRRDFESEEFGVVLEADGRIGHEGSGRLRDVRRDRKALRDGKVTLRAAWIEAALEPCDLALDLHGALTSRGYREPILPCGPTCPVPRARRWAS